jgi:tetratricopeptide (TPR) repeat protein
MRILTSSCLDLLLLACLAAPAAGQDSADLMARGIAASAALDPRAAATLFEAVLARDSLHAEANWRAALALVDIGKQTPDNVKSPARDSLYRLADRYARRAIRLAPDDADAHFTLAMAAGMTALSVGIRQQVRYAIEVREEALRALQIDPKHDGALHVLGRWNAEIKRVSGFELFFAKSFLGGKVFDQASWPEAARLLEAAVDHRPNFIFHRIDLALIYIDMKRYSDARVQLAVIPTLPIQDVLDPVYSAQAAYWRARIANKRDGD